MCPIACWNQWPCKSIQNFSSADITSKIWKVDLHHRYLFDCRNERRVKWCSCLRLSTRMLSHVSQGQRHIHCNKYLIAATLPAVVHYDLLLRNYMVFFTCNAMHYTGKLCLKNSCTKWGSNRFIQVIPRMIRKKNELSTKWWVTTTFCLLFCLVIRSHIKVVTCLCGYSSIVL